MMKINYVDYLRSDDWKDRRKELLNEANNECEECGDKATVLHHLKYDNLGFEVYGVDVIALCKDCHKRLHLEDGKDIRYKGYGEYGEWY